MAWHLRHGIWGYVASWDSPWALVSLLGFMLLLGPAKDISAREFVVLCPSGLFILQAHIALLMANQK